VKKQLAVEKSGKGTAWSSCFIGTLERFPPNVEDPGRHLVRPQRIDIPLAVRAAITTAFSSTTFHHVFLQLNYRCACLLCRTMYTRRCASPGCTRTGRQPLACDDDEKSYDGVVTPRSRCGGDDGGGGPEREVAFQPRAAVCQKPKTSDEPIWKRAAMVPPSQRAHAATRSFALEITCPRTGSLVTTWWSRRICAREVLPLASGCGEMTAQPAYCRVVAALSHAWDAPVRELIVLPPDATSHARTQPSLPFLQRPSLNLQPSRSMFTTDLPIRHVRPLYL
jgi:hypothetical protein